MEAFGVSSISSGQGEGFVSSDPVVNLCPSSKFTRSWSLLSAYQKLVLTMAKSKGDDDFIVSVDKKWKG